MDWEERYRSGDIPWEKGAPCPALLELIDSGLFSGRVLVPGCGLGHDVRALAAGGADPVGLDIAPLAVEQARRMDPGAPPHRYRLGDLFNLPESDREAFDGVWEHTCFCAIDPARRKEYAQAVAFCLLRGKVFAAIFYLRPWDPDEDQTQGPPFGVGEEELDRLFSETFELQDAWVPRVTFEGREGREQVRIYRRS
jgi:SAM-dependent methyltransferase